MLAEKRRNLQDMLRRISLESSMESEFVSLIGRGRRDWTGGEGGK